MRATLALVPVVSAIWLIWAATPSAASRFGAPWQARVVVDQTLVRDQPDQASPAIGPLGRGTIVVVTGEQTSQDGHEWTITTLGAVPTEDVAELFDPWVADVIVDSTPVYAKPNARDAIRLNAKKGDLLRVTGVSPGLSGDPNMWWATTEGYVALNALKPSSNPWAAQWTVPDGLLALNGWWGRASSGANVRAGPSTEAPLVGKLPAGQLLKVLVEGPGQDVEGSATWYRIDGGRYAGGWVHSSLVKELKEQPRANTTEPKGGSDSGRWVVVDRRLHTLTLVDHGSAVFTTFVALGVAGRETPTGTYSTWGKYRADEMTSTSVRNPGGYYDLPNVPDTQYYLDGGFAVHGTYWHDDFGTDESHGCVNVTWTDGRYLFSQTTPFVADNELTAPPGQPATDIVIL
ncbi:MAG TPA: L,D-transpeptidase family protein [Chloroflexota bacterium]